MELVGCGRTDSGQTVVIAAPDRKGPCDEGMIGEIWVNGPGVAQGYFGKPDDAGRFHGSLGKGDPRDWLRTGDLGFVHQGELFVLGRGQDQLVIRGRNIFAHDVEWGLTDLFPGQRTGRCVAFAGAEGDQLLVVQELDPRADGLDHATAMAAIRHRVAAVLGVEVHAVVLAPSGAIPHTTSGKPRRRRCRERYLSGDLPRLAHWERGTPQDPNPTGGPAEAPAKTATAIRTWLVERLARRLGSPTEGIANDRPFVDLGLTSLDAVEICAELESWLGRPVPPTILYSRPSVANLSDWLAQGAAGDAPPAAPENAPPPCGRGAGYPRHVPTGAGGMDRRPI